MARKKNILAILAHQDDEVALSISLAREVAAGHQVRCVYLTDGAANGQVFQIRNAESRRVLTGLGIPEDQILFIGSDHGIPDSNLPENMDLAYKHLKNAVSDLEFQRIYCLSYEGGHQDHDASHILALTFAAERGVLCKVWQVPFYNGFRTFGKLFRTLKPIPLPRSFRRPNLSFAEGLRHGWIFLNYPSQWRTWIGLGPEFCFRRLLLREETLMTVNMNIVFDRPHRGLLLYERLMNYPYDRFRAAADNFLKSRGIPDKNNSYK